MWEIRLTTENSIGGASRTILGKANGSATSLNTVEIGPSPHQESDKVPTSQAREAAQILATRR